MEMVDAEAARSARERSTNPNAVDLVLQAGALQNQPTNLQRDAAAQVLYERALQLDPTSASTMARLAMTLMSQRFVRGFWLDGNDIERVEKLVADVQSIAPASEDRSYILQQNLSNAQLIIYPDSAHGSLYQ
jgi:adenylate cyclase